jgi:hypothetical protein
MASGPIETVSGRNFGIGICFGTCYLVPMVFQFVNMAMNLGLKRCLTTCKDYPALLLMPTFSIWAFGSREKKSYKNCKGSSNFGVSFTYTLLNTLITFSGVILSSIYTYMNSSIREWEVVFWQIISATIGAIIISAILVAIISCMNNCMCCSCICCCKPCLPMTEASTIFKHEQEEISNVQIPMTEILNTNEIV